MSDFRIRITDYSGSHSDCLYFNTTEEDVVQEFNKLVIAVIREDEYHPSFLYINPKRVIASTMCEIDEEEQPTKVLYRFVA